MNIPWYKEGLKFSCTECGQCCSGSPGYVWITEEEGIEMAAQLNISLDEFVEKYTRVIGNRVSLKEVKRGGNYDCVFLNGKRCTLYKARPNQCRTFPWWDENLESKEAWEDAATRCEGINANDAPLITLGEIRKARGENC